MGVQVYQSTSVVMYPAAEREGVELAEPLQAAIVSLAQGEGDIAPASHDAIEQLLLFLLRHRVVAEERLQALAIVLALDARHLAAR